MRITRNGQNHWGAAVAQLAEQLFCKQQVTGSIPVGGSRTFFARSHKRFWRRNRLMGRGNARFWIRNGRTVWVECSFAPLPCVERGSLQAHPPHPAASPPNSPQGGEVKLSCSYRRWVARKSRILLFAVTWLFSLAMPWPSSSKI